MLKLRRRSAVADVAVETLDGFRRHQSGRNAAVLAYWGFLSVFPLLLAATTILGFVLDGRPELQADIVDSALSQIPVIGSTIEDNAGDLDGNPWALVIGLVTALWASMKAFIGVQAAFDDVWEVDINGRANAAVKRLRALIGLVVIGLAQVGTVVLSGVTSEADIPAISRILIVIGALAINAAVVSTMYRYLTAAPVTWTLVWPGGLFAGVGFTVLQLVGTLVVSRMIANASEVYGTFASMLALMSWFSLHALISLYGAELNAAVERRRDRRRDFAEWLGSGFDRSGLAQ
ncbi:MAG: YihY/virulence factor BrkB family protein [Ilumatobacteraceae bacterium]